MKRGGLAHAGAVNLAAGLTGSLITMVLALVIARHLGPDGTGTFFQAAAAFMIVANIAELGADTGLVRFCAAAIATGRSNQLRFLISHALWPVVIIGLVASVLTLATVRWWSGPLADHDPGLKAGLVLIGVPLIWVTALSSIMLAATRGMGSAVIYPALQNLLLPVVRLILITGVLLAGWQITAVLYAWIAPLPFIGLCAGLCVGSMLAKISRKSAEPMPASQKRTLNRQFWRFNTARGFSAAVEILLEWVDVLIVAAVRSPAEAGVYGVVTRCVRAGELVQQAARIAVGPQVSAALARRDLATAQQIYAVVTAVMVLAAWPFFLLLAWFAPGVLAIFGAGFSSGATAMTILSLAMGLATAAGIVQTVLLMGGRSSWQLVNKSSALACNVALNIVLVPRWGIAGAAIAWAVAVVVDTVLALWRTRQILRAPISGARVLPAMLLALAVFGLGGGLVRLHGAQLADLLIALLVLVPVYLLACWQWREAWGWSVIRHSLRAPRATVR